MNKDAEAEIERLTFEWASQKAASGDALRRAMQFAYQDAARVCRIADKSTHPSDLAEAIESRAKEGARREEREASNVVFAVQNKTSSILFATKEDAQAYVGSFGASTAGGMSITQMPVCRALPNSQAKPVAYLYQHDDESGWDTHAPPHGGLKVKGANDERRDN